MLNAAPAVSLIAIGSCWSLPASTADPVVRTTVPSNTLAPADTAGAAEGRADTGLFAFEIADDVTGSAMPGRLTFVGETNDGEAIFRNFAARPEDLAVRESIVYALSGRATITVPAGTYEVFASRGLEWSTSSVRFTMRPGRSVAWAARLTRDVDTAGWASGDFHLHTLTHSGHGDSNMPERIISLIGEGVEFAVATDHNHHTDYGPTIAELEAESHLTAVVGNEVSVPVGHFNAFPLSPERTVPSNYSDANGLFQRLRAEPNSFGIVPVIQVNHPRWEGIDYFNIAGLDSVTAEPERGTWSDDFDTLEVLNENAGWGYHEPFVSGVPTGSETHSVLQDWFNLLNLGRRHFAVGNSDSHTVGYAFAGYPRNFVALDDADPSSIDVPKLAQAVKRGRMFTTTGPFLEVTVNGAGMGSRTTATDGGVDVRVRVQAASWIDVDRVRIVVNGADALELPVEGEPDEATGVRAVDRLDETTTLTLERDAWIVVIVEGDDDLAPIVSGGERPILPVAISNPVWVDVDADGRWTSPAAHADALVRAAVDATAAEAVMADLNPAERGLAILAAARAQRPFAAALVGAALRSGETGRRERLFALRAAEALADAALGAAAATAFAASEGDPAMQVAALRALGACTPDDAGAAIGAFLASPAADQTPDALLTELITSGPDVVAREWMVIGYFDALQAGTVTNGPLGPEEDGETQRTWDGRGGVRRWQARDSGDNGYLDLRGLGGSDADEANAAALAQCWVHVAETREVMVALGTDDGCRVMLNGEIMYDNPARKGASAMEHTARWTLQQGWNRVVLAVENGTGGFGAYFRILGGDVRIARAPS